MIVHVEEGVNDVTLIVYARTITLLLHQNIVALKANQKQNRFAIQKNVIDGKPMNGANVRQRVDRALEFV